MPGAVDWHIHLIVHGRYDLLQPDHPQVYAFTRTLGDEQLLVILNFSREEPVFAFPDEMISHQPELLIANYPIDVYAELSGIFLRPFEASVYQLPTTH